LRLAGPGAVRRRYLPAVEDGALDQVDGDVSGPRLMAGQSRWSPARAALNRYTMQTHNGIPSVGRVGIEPTT
jgi:hypothetical protein